MAKSFLDTNIYVYAVDRGDLRKHEAAKTLIKELSARGETVVSTQILQEFYTIATRKLGQDQLVTKNSVAKMAQNELVSIDYGLISNAIDASILSPISFWDALVLSAAASANCRYLLTEDLQHGSKWSGVEIVNPFI